MPVDETPELYRTMERFRTVSMRLSHEGYGLEWLPDGEESTLGRWRRWLRRAYHAARSDGREAERVSGVPWWRQMIDLVQVQRRFDFATHHYYWYHLYRRERYRRAGLFATAPQMQPLLRYIGDVIEPETRAVIYDKARFREHCRRHGLPSIPTVAVFDGGQVDWREGHEALPRVDLFAKPIDAHSGTGARTWRYADGTFRRGGAEAPPAASVVDELRQLSRKMPYLLQPRVENHPEIVPTAGDGLASVRLISLIERGARSAEILVGQIRLPGEEAIVSNATAGGLLVPINVATGTLAAAGVKREPFLGPLSRHPGTGRPIEGVRLPEWDRMQALAMRAHATLPEVPMLGWDLAITPAGPVLIEVNLGFGIETSQVLDLPPIALTGIPQIALDYYDRTRAHARRGNA